MGADSRLLNTGVGSSRGELPCALGYADIRVPVNRGRALWFPALIVTHMWLDVGGLPSSLIWLVLIHQRCANLPGVSGFLSPDVRRCTWGFGVWICKESRCWRIVVRPGFITC